MSQAAPTFSQIKAQVAAIRKKRQNARNIAIRTLGRWSGETLLQDGEDRYAIYQCDSPLAMRVALREDVGDATRVLLTPLDDTEIQEDIRCRLRPRKIKSLDSWEVVKSLFQARMVDPRITKLKWVADMLIELNPPAGYPSVASGFLDAETVWSILLERVIGLSADTTDLMTILKWSTDVNNVSRFQNSSEEFRTAAIEWLTGQSGASAKAVLNCVFAQDKPDALPIGLALGVVFHPEASGKLDRAAGKFEATYLGGKSLNRTIIDTWQASATEVVRLSLSDAKLQQRQLDRADEILSEVGADTFAWLSDTSPQGFHQRLAQLGQQLSTIVSSAEITDLKSLEEIRDRVFQHDSRKHETRQLERVDMALRLVRWLALLGKQNKPKSLAESASNYLVNGGYVDWARLKLQHPEQIAELADACIKLHNRVTEICERNAETFAKLLKDWTASKTSDDVLLPVEQMLDRLVAPLAAEDPVLLLVIDGMSVAVFRELMHNIVGLGRDWTLLAEDDIGLRPGLATIPSITEASRTSLLCGKLTAGSQHSEGKEFAKYPALLAQSRGSHPPVLFHKGGLKEDDELAHDSPLRQKIGDTQQQIVGVVINAVDDHLSKGDQIDVHWSRDQIKILPTLLHEAKNAGRTVIMVSDHGHILDHDTKKEHDGESARWRLAEGKPGQGELEISGPRVVLPESKTLIAPWSETIRYGGKQNGYHGGLNPQEMVIPIAVLISGDDYPAGWSEPPEDLPDWWEAAFTDIPAQEESDIIDGSSQKPPRKTKKKPKKKEPTLFDAEPLPEEVQVPAWIESLFKSEIFLAQKEMAGRAVPSEEIFGKLLKTLGRREKMLSSALAKAIGYPPSRLPGMLAVASRVLNIDGYEVLTRDDSSDTVVLDRKLLLKQFDLDG